jgi:hypothetical protein
MCGGKRGDLPLDGGGWFVRFEQFGPGTYYAVMALLLGKPIRHPALLGCGSRDWRTAPAGTSHDRRADRWHRRCGRLYYVAVCDRRVPRGSSTGRDKMGALLSLLAAPLALVASRVSRALSPRKRAGRHLHERKPHSHDRYRSRRHAANRVLAYQNCPMGDRFAFDRCLPWQDDHRAVSRTRRRRHQRLLVRPGSLAPGAESSFSYDTCSFCCSRLSQHRIGKVRFILRVVTRPWWSAVQAAPARTGASFAA